MEGADDGELSSGGGGEDRLSLLPDDVLLHILLRLRDAASAAQTSVLSRRWRRVWALLPELRISGNTPPDLALAAHEAPAILSLSVTLNDAPAGSLAAWLPAASRRLTGDLAILNASPREDPWLDSEADDAAEDDEAFELPCFERATKVSLDLGFLAIAAPPSGVFARLTALSLSNVLLQGGLGDAVSSPRCPSLRDLAVRDVWGLDDLTIHSETLLVILLNGLAGLQRLAVAAPALTKLSLLNCFDNHRESNPPIATISTPLLEELVWGDSYDPISVQLGEMARLQRLGVYTKLLYGPPVPTSNRDVMSLLQHFKFIHRVTLVLVCLQDLGNTQLLMEEIMTMPPVISSLEVIVILNGHSFGASLFHVLRMSTGLRRLKLIFEVILTSTDSEVQTTCPPGCICNQLQNWEYEEFVLNHLEELEIFQFAGTEHEVAVLKQLCRRSPSLKEPKIIFCPRVTESKMEEFEQMFQNFLEMARFGTL